MDFRKSFLAAASCLLLVLCSITSFAQRTRVLRGTVYDEGSEPLVGAAVILKGGNKGTGTTANLDGQFSINVPSATNATIEVSFIGMETKAVVVTPEMNNITIVLKSDNSLDAAVITTGYGLIQNKENFAGSAYQVTHEELALKPAARIDNMLAGVVPGLTVIEDSTNGRPSVKIRVRGDGSLSASNEPLWVIDGVPIYTGNRTNSITGTSGSISPLSYMNPDDIESMTVLKDASTTALYGADGANGVILVTTKNAKIGQANFNASVKYGVSSIDQSTRIKYCDAQQWLELAKLGWVNSGRTIENFPYQDNEYNSYSTTNTDWFKEFVKNGHSTQVNFSANGGTETMDNFFSLGYFANETPYIGNTQQRYSIRNKTSVRFSEKLEMMSNLSASYNHNDLFSLYSSYDEILPIFSPYNDDGSYRFYNWYSTGETYELVQRKFHANTLPQRNENENYQNTISAQANITLTWKPFSGMTITSQSGASFTNIYQATYSAMSNFSGLSDSGKNGYSNRYAVFDSVLNENIRANYNKTFAGKHNVLGMVGLEMTDKKHPYLSASGNGFINDHIKEVTYADASTLKGGSNTSHTRSLSYIAHASYTYDRRYTLSFSGRRQGYSSFSEFSRWGSFLSAGATWNVHREHFWKSNIIDQLTLKASYGNNGNSRIDTSSSYGSYSIGTGSYYGGVAGAVQSSPANPGLSWEITYITNLGATIGLFKRLTLSFEYYNRKTTDLLYSGRVSSVITDGSVMRNVGEITNKGFEFEVNSTNIKRGDFTWSTSINGARNRNLITKLYKGMHTGFFDSIWVEGACKDDWWLVRWAGVDPTNGAPMWYDKNGDLTYTFSYDDRVLLPEYSKQPDLYGGVSNDFSWGDFSLRIMFDYTIGGWEYFYKFDYGSDVIGSNMPVEMMHCWSTPGEVNEHPKFTYKRADLAGYNSTKCLYSSTSAQLRSLTFSYRLPKNISRHLNVTNAVVSLVGDNLYFWSPGQSRTHNSYKTFKFSDGMTRTISGQISFNF